MDGRSQIHLHLKRRFAYPSLGFKTSCCKYISPQMCQSNSLKSSLPLTNFHGRFATRLSFLEGKIPLHSSSRPHQSQLWTLVWKNKTSLGGGSARQREGWKRHNSAVGIFFKELEVMRLTTLRRDRSSISAGSLRQRRKLGGHGSLVNEQVIQYSLCWV